MIDWRTIFEIAHPEPPATEAEIAAFVAEVGQPLTSAEVTDVNRYNRNPWLVGTPQYDTWQPFDASQWTMPNRPVPESYLSFLRYSNGGDFHNGQRYFQMFGTGLRTMMLDRAIPQYMPHALPFAFNGGGVMYFFDMREPAVNGEYPIIVAHAGSLTFDPHYAPRVAGSFLEVCQGRYNVERRLHGGIVLDATAWDTCTDPKPMLDDCQSQRQLRLFTVACARRVAYLLQQDCFREAIEVAERLADGNATDKERDKAKQACKKQLASAIYWPPVAAASTAAKEAVDDDRDQGSWNGAWAAAVAESEGPHGSPEWLAVRAKQADLLREIVGNPHRPVVIDPAWLNHNSGVVRDLLRAAYEDRRYDVLPILADALEEAGCTDAAILGHCRGPNHHVHGCWVLDALRDADWQ